MKIFRFALQFWITLASLLSFGLGWMFLAHSSKPVQSVSNPTQPANPSSGSTIVLPTLQPLQTLQLDNGGEGINVFQSPPISVQPLPQTFSSAPTFRTGGS